MTKRTDIHRPAIADPAEYEDVGYIDNHPEEGGCWWAQGYPGNRKYFEGHYSERGGCDHCGHHSLRYVTLFVHKPTDTIIAVGQSCASKLSMSSRHAVEAKREIERQALQRKVDAYKEANPEVSHFLEGVYEEAIFVGGEFRFFLMDLRHKLIQYGELSEKQTAVVEKAIENQKRFEEERAKKKAEEPDPSPVPVTEERIQITGKILSVKWKPGYMPGEEVAKMLVLDDRGFKVWGTRPESLLVRADNDEGFIEQNGFMHRPAGKGDRVTFQAKVTVSNDDETFGFFKRPTKAEVIDHKQEQMCNG